MRTSMLVTCEMRHEPMASLKLAQFALQSFLFCSGGAGGIEGGIEGDGGGKLHEPTPPMTLWVSASFRLLCRLGPCRSS